MSHGQHRAPKPARRRLRKLAAGLSLAAAAATTGLLTNTLTDVSPADTTWGAPDTGTSTGPTVGTGAVTPLDTTWG